MITIKQKSAVICAGMLIAGTASANNADQVVGYSAISNGMAGAVVATPQDVTSSLNNPAGLAFLDLGREGTRFDMNVGFLNPIRHMNDVQSDSNIFISASGGFAFQSDILGRDFTISVGAYPISGGGVDFPTEAFRLANGQNAAIVATRMSLRTGPALAYRVNDNLAVGAGLYLVSNQMSIKNFQQNAGMPPTITSMNFPSDTAYGGSFTLGTTYQIDPKTRFGAAYTSRSYTDHLKWNMDDGKWSLKFNDPQTVALGLSYEPTSDLQLEADFKWVDFSRVRNSSILSGPTTAKSKTLAYGWDDQRIYALGAKYRLSDRWTLLGGVSYANSPLKPDDINNNAGITAIIQRHWSAGVTAKVSKFTDLTLSLIHGVEEEVTASVGPPNKVSFETNFAMLQFTYKH